MHRPGGMPLKGIQEGLWLWAHKGHTGQALNLCLQDDLHPSAPGPQDAVLSMRSLGKVP